VADFWNSALLSDGCVAYGKNYFYIDWNGNIMPCVFVPYYTHNVKEMFSKGQRLSEIYNTEMFKKGREWQKNYHDKDGKLGNMLMPCSIRDHHKEFMEIINSCNVKFEDESACSFSSKEYHKNM
jgi:radical SAM protein with 4Fe4S-binding SPASM domain